MSNESLIKKNQDLLKKKNVVGIGMGEKWKNGVNTHVPALLVFVSKKEKIADLSENDLIPDEIEGHKTDVVGRMGLFKAQAFTARTRPVKAGMSCGHLWVTAGTLGGWFKDQDGEIVGLSNNHVIANENDADRSEYPGERGHWTVQPGVLDNNNWAQNKIGNVKDFVVLKPSGNNQDSATFRVDNTDLVDAEINQIGIPIGFNLNPQVGLYVQKSGRTTEHTVGKIIATNATVYVQYDMGVLMFENQIITTAMSEGGDSGSLLLDLNQQIVGLLFAGSSTATIHNPIQYPKDKWGLEIYEPSPIVETAAYTLISNGVEVENGGLPDFPSLLKKARDRARLGETVTISFNLSVSPDLPDLPDLPI